MDAFIPAHFFQALRNVFVLAINEAAIAIEECHLRAETAEGLGEFESYIARAENQEVLRDVIEFQCLDVRERPRLDQPRNRFQRGPRARIDDDILAAKRARPAVGQLNLDGLGGDETPRTHNQFRAALPVMVEMDVDKVLDHLALAFAHRRHVDADIVFADAELLAAIKERGDLGAVDDVLAGQARDVGARAAHIFALDHHDALSLLGGSPGNQFSAGAAAEHDEIIFFRMGAGRVHNLD